MGYEIERKFLLDKQISFPRFESRRSIEQGYLPHSGNQEIRLRVTDEQYSLTIKSLDAIVRSEWETPLSQDKFKELWPQTAGRRIRKTRSTYVLDGHTVEIDEYQDAWKGLRVAEVEFESIESARTFRIPSDWGPEITWDARYKNSSLSSANALPSNLPGTSKTVSYSVGAIPYRQTRGEQRLVVVSTRRKDRWIFPKGQVEPQKSFEEIALQEADEEAGVRGELVGHPILLPYYRDSGTMNLWLYPLRVTQVLEVWLESTQRERQIVSAEELRKLNPQSLLGPGLEALKFRLGFGTS